MGSAFGAAGSLVILLVWVYYSSIILYLGAEFAKHWALAFGSPIMPSKYAETVQKVEVVSKGETLQEAEQQKEIVVDANKKAAEVVADAEETKEKIINDADKKK